MSTREETTSDSTGSTSSDSNDSISHESDANDSESSGSNDSDSSGSDDSASFDSDDSGSSGSDKPKCLCSAEVESFGPNDLEPGVVEREAFCRSYACVLNLGMKQFSKAYAEYADSDYPSFTNSKSGRLPQRLRKELAEQLEKDILPSLSDRIFKLYNVLEIDPDDYSFKLQPALNIVLEIDELATRMISSITSVWDQLVYGPFPTFLQASGDDMTGKSESEPFEQISYIPWKRMLLSFHLIIPFLAQTFSIIDNYVRQMSNIEMWNPNEMWHDCMIKLKDNIDSTIEHIGRSESQLYICSIREPMRAVERSLIEMNSIIKTYNLATHPATGEPANTHQLKAQLLKPTILIIKLCALGSVI